jgi:cyanophycinase
MPMKKFIQFTFLLLLLSSSASFSQKGHLVIIGGGERAEYIMQRIVELAGGKNARILVIPNASSEPVETGAYQSKEMLRYGASFSDYLIFTRETADADSNLAKMNGITGVFFSGGDQSYLTRDLLGTKLLDKVYELYNNGGLISGTSAGAAVMSEIMLTGNELINKDSNSAFISIQKDNIEVKQGFGFVKSVIIDQHFLKRKRHNRLISVVLEHPQFPGVAIDEETSIVVYPDDVFEVLGENQVLVYDATGARNIKFDKNGNLSAENIKMHILSNGDKCNLKTREITSNGSKEKL